MDMRRVYSAAAALLCTAAVSFGQNFNPTVEVTNAYQGKPSEVHKPLLGMAVPDSLLRFDSAFDYEVFNKKYEGAYSFSPYNLNNSPEQDAFRGKSLYLKAGAGYSLHPQLDFVFSPVQKGPFQMSVYASHRSYFGRYKGVKAVREENFWMLDPDKERSYAGHDAVTTAGLDGRYDFGKSFVSFGAGYYGLMAKDTVVKRSYNAADLYARVRSNNPSGSYFFYDAGARLRVGMDNLDYYQGFTKPSLVKGRQKLGETEVVVDGSLGPVFDAFHRLLVGFDFSTRSYSSLFKNNIGRLAVTPKYQFETGAFKFSLGVKLEGLFKGAQVDTLSFGRMHSRSGQVIYPDLHVGFSASDNVLVYASVTGGSDLNTYSSLIARNHHLVPSYAASSIFQQASMPLMDNTIERINASAGVRGNIRGRLEFDVKAGYARVDNGLMDRLVDMVTHWAYGHLGVAYFPGITYVDYDLLYGDALLGWKSDKVSVDAALHYRGTKFRGEEEVYAFRFPRFSGDVRAVWNFNPRMYVGSTLGFCSRRTGYAGGLSPLYFADAGGTSSENLVPFRVPGYLDLGLLAGYRLNRKLGLWLESGNILFDNVQKDLLYVEKTPWVTVGITLSL